MQGAIGGNEAEFSIGIGKEAQAKYGFKAGDSVQGSSLPVADLRMETVEYYKTSGLRVIESEERKKGSASVAGGTVELTVYRERGHRRLDIKTYTAKCRTCIWGCQMPVEIIVDQWNPHVKQPRFETFCCGSKACSLYRAGPTRKVPGSKGMTLEEEDWVDKDAVSHREEDE